MYEIDSRSEYYDVVETIADSAREHDPSSPHNVAQNCIASARVLGDQLTVQHSAEPYAMDRLQPTDVLRWTKIGTVTYPLDGTDGDALMDLSFRERAVYVLEADLRKHADYNPK